MQTHPLGVVSEQMAIVGRYRLPQRAIGGGAASRRAWFMHNTRVVATENDATFGTVFADSNEYIVIKIEADASFTGNVSSITLTWL